MACVHVLIMPFPSFLPILLTSILGFLSDLLGGHRYPQSELLQSLLNIAVRLTHFLFLDMELTKNRPTHLHLLTKDMLKLR